MQFLVTGGYPKKDLWKQRYGFRYEEAFVILLDWDVGQIVKELCYKSQPDTRPPEASQQFKAATIVDGLLMVPSSTEIVFVDPFDFTVKRHFSHQSFNDLHHATVKDGMIYVANTGREAVQVFSLKGELIVEYHQAENPTWKKYGEDADIRFIGGTKPHEVHLNYIFFIEGEPWFTRFEQRDAVSLNDKTKRIDLHVSQGRPHDGLVIGDLIYFTITDGYVVIANTKTLKHEAVIDLNQISGKRGQLGWCRGLEVVGDQLFIGFSGIRPSKFRECGEWILLKKKRLPARVAQYDLLGKSLVKEVKIHDRGAAIFSIKYLKA